MRHVRLFAVALVLSLVCFAGSALADSTVDMQLIGVGGNNGGGVYTYPYNFSINGGASTPLVCDTFDNEVAIGETWKATVSGLLSGNGLFGVNTNDYKAAGLIFQGIIAGNIDPTIGNWAIWGLFSSNAQSNSFFNNSAVLNVYNNALANAPNSADSLFSNLVLYTPVAGTQSWGGTPQEYIGISAPEPGELALLATGLLLGLLVFTTRKRLGLKCVVAAQ